MTGVLYGVGVGPGDPELMTLKAVRLCESCDVIALPYSGDGVKTAYDIACQAVPKIKEKQQLGLYMPMTKNRTLWEDSHNQAAQQVMELLDMGKTVVFLTLGDPTIYSTYIYVHERVVKAGYETHIIPGVPSFCAVAARLNIGLTEASQPLHIIPASYESVQESINYCGTKVLMKTGKSIEQVKELLREKGLFDQAKMVVRCGMEGEQVFESLKDAEDAVSYFSVIVVKDPCEGTEG